MIISNVRRVIQQEPGVYRLNLISSSSLYMDFTGGFGVSLGVPSSAASLLTTVRASDGYSDDIAGNWTLFGPGVPRITNKGLLVEEARTNSIRNNSMQGAVAGVIGSGGALPTNWANNTTPTGITYTVSLASSLGVEYLALRVQGTPSASNNIRIAFDSTTQIVANTGETWALSMFLAILAGDLTNISNIKLTHQERDSGGASLRGTQGPDVKASLTSALARFSYAVAMGASTARDQPELNIAVTSGQAIDLTIAIGWPQLELGAFATSPIRTTSAAATRAADVVTTPFATSDAVTLFGQAVPGGVVAATAIIAQLDNGTANNRHAIYKNAASGAKSQISVVGGATQSNMGVTPNPNVSLGVSTKMCMAAATNDYAFVADASDVTVDGSASLPTVTTLRLGAATAGTPWNSYIQRVAVFPTRLTNAQLQAMTR